MKPSASQIACVNRRAIARRPAIEIHEGTVPPGWTVSCPLPRVSSDRIGRRKLVIAGATLMLLGVSTWVLFGNLAILRGIKMGILMEVASGAAMLPYSAIKAASSSGGCTQGLIESRIEIYEENYITGHL